MTKYLLYAFGEIILVVAGILIALNINNANEKRIKNEKITNILGEIQKDLVSDIAESVEIFDNYMWVDSIQNLILNNKYTFEDYEEGLPVLINYYDDFVVQNNGYENLMRNIDNVPVKHEPLLEDLKHLYITVKSDIDVYNERISNTVYKNIDFLYTQPWYLKRVKRIVTEEEIGYLLNNPKYKGSVVIYMVDSENVFERSQHFRIDAIDLYHKISEHLRSTDSIPEIVSYTSRDTTLLNEFAGRYELENTVGAKWASYIDITTEDNKLNFVNSKGTSTTFNWHKDSVFWSGFHVLVFNKYQKGDLFLSGGINGNATYIKKDK